MARSIRSVRGAAPGPDRRRSPGGGRGIGRALALRFAREGATVVISSRTASDLDAVLAADRRRGWRARTRGGRRRVRPRRRPPTRCRRRSSAFGRVDILVNNVGGSVGRRHDPFTGDDATLRGHAHPEPHLGVVDDPCRAPGDARPAASAASSASARVRRSAPPASLAYTTAKHALVGFTKQLAQATRHRRHHRQPAVPGVDQHVAARLREGRSATGRRSRRRGPSRSRQRAAPRARTRGARRAWPRSSRPTRARASPAR